MNKDEDTVVLNAKTLIMDWSEEPTVIDNTLSATNHLQFHWQAWIKTLQSKNKKLDNK